MKPFFRVFKLLDSAERRQVLLLMPGILLMAVLQLAAIGFMSPFLNLISSDKSIDENMILNFLYHNLHFDNQRSFTIFVGFLALILLVISNAFAMLMSWLLLRFAWLRNHSLSYKLLDTYLHKPYVYFLNMNSSELEKNMLSEVQQAIQGMLIPGMQMLSNAVIAISIIIFLLILDPLLALTTAATLTLAYAAVFAIVQRKLKRIGKERVVANKQRFQTAAESLGGIKEIKLLGNEDYFLDKYARASTTYARHMALSDALSFIPRYAIDTIAFGGLLVIILYMLASNQSIDKIIPVVGLYAFAGYKLMPALQQIYRSLTKARFNAAAVDVVARDLAGIAKAKELRQNKNNEALGFNSEIVLKDIDFSYPDSKEKLFKKLNLKIKANTQVAFVGTTGSGKTTVVDIILGLLKPDSGEIIIDGKKLSDENLRNWQRNIGYVPQNIYLSDSTIAENIAFGVDKKDIDLEAVIKAAKIADLQQFIEKEMENSYETVVGERGVRLSGGQRQRIGIARALYHDPAILVLDEATSALDNITEKSVFKAIDNAAKSKTIIMIAHRISTVKSCDEIFIIDHGDIVSSGNYGKLIEKSDSFKALADGLS